MHLVNIDDPDNGARSFSLRTSVRAIPCPEGVAVVSGKGDVLDTSRDHGCAVVLDEATGEFDLLPLALFDALYVESDSTGATVEPTPAPTVEPTPAPTVEPTPAPTVEPTPAPSDGTATDSVAALSAPDAGTTTAPSQP